ncbi:hypothetical protein PGB90_007539 [Kerria lacca]
MVTEHDRQKLFITLTLFSVIDQFVLDLQSLRKDKLEIWAETVEKIKYKKVPYRLLKLLEMVPIQQASEEFTHALNYGNAFDKFVPPNEQVCLLAQLSNTTKFKFIR